MDLPETPRCSWQKFREGNKDILLEIYQNNYVHLMNYGVRLSTDRAFIHDCLMEMLLALWEKRESLPEVSNVRGYLTISLKRIILGKFKHQKWKESKHASILSESDQFESPYEDYLTALQSNEATRRVVLNCMNKLTSRQKELLRLKFFDDYSYDEIAEMGKITKRTAYNIIHDGLKILKTELQKNKIDLTAFEVLLIGFTLFSLTEHVADKISL